MKKAPKIVLSIVVAMSVLMSGTVVQATGSTLDKLNKAKEEKNQTQSALNTKKNQIDDLQDTKEGLKGELNSFNSKLTQVSDNLEELETQIDEKNEEITETQAALDEAKKTEEHQYECMKKRIKFMYERGDTAYLEMMFSSASFGEFLNKTEYVNKVSEYDQRMLREYQETKELIAEKEADLQQEKVDLDDMKAQVEAKQKEVQALVAQTSSNIAGYSSQISAAEQEALLYEAKMAEQEANIAALKKQYEQELALSRLSAASAKRDISQVTFSETDRTMLATIIYCEAGGEPYAGKLAVGAVVVNRLLSSVYPDTITGVIYQRKQFSPVGSGRFDLALANGKATSSCYQAADEAMQGNTNVGNCVYFRTPIEGLTGISIGGHIFY
ncbi:MAG: cell wall hydrolase [Lachnospiraceae bacterium]|nr:cell wall hydrolase [Lachnospiraceae bacterium]